MTALLITAVLVPWSIWRQMHARAVTTKGLVKLPAIFALASALTFATGAETLTRPVLEYAAASALLAIVFGLWRGEHISLWNDGGTPMQKGNRATLIAWIAMIALKVALGTLAAVTGWLPAQSAGEVLAFFAVTMAAQNLVVARRVSVPTVRRRAPDISVMEG